jgi:hypothetical protein
MATYYIDPSHTNNGDGDGTADQTGAGGAFNTWPTALASDNEYYQKCGTVDPRTDDIDINGLSNVIVGAYYGAGIIGISGEKPAITLVFSSTSTGDWDPLGGNIWEWGGVNLYWDPTYIMGLGSLGTKDDPSWAQRRVYTGQESGGDGNTPYNEFDTFGQWDGNLGSGTEGSSLWIYNDVNPVTEWGTIYYGRAQRVIFNIINELSNITIKDITCRHSAIGIKIYGGGGDTGANILIDNCTFEHCYIGISYGSVGSLDNLIIQNCDIYASASIGIQSSSGTRINSETIRNNRVYNIGLNSGEGIGAIYGKMLGASANDPVVIDSCYVDGVILGEYWHKEAFGLYTENASTYVDIRNSYVTNTGNAGLHSNAGEPGIRFYNNVVDNPKGFNDSDANLNNNAETLVYNNLFLNATSSAMAVGRTATSTKGNVRMYNNVCISDGTGNGINFNSVADTLDDSFNDNNCFYNFNLTLTRDGATAGLVHTLGNGNIEADPLLDSKYKPKAASPCINAGVTTLSNKDWFNSHLDSTHEVFIVSV